MRAGRGRVAVIRRGTRGRGRSAVIRLGSRPVEEDTSQSPEGGRPARTQTNEEGTEMGLDNPLHIAFLLIVLLLVFGAKRLPEMGKSLGSGMRGFKDAINPDADLPPPLTAPGHATPRPVER